MNDQRALDLLPDYVLGSLSGEERQELDRALAASPALAAEARAIAESFGVLAAALPPLPAAPALKQRLLTSIGAEKHAPFAKDLARHFDLAVERVRALFLAMYDAATVWDQGPLPGISVMHFDGGPLAAAADCGFVRLKAGVHFPWHRHLGDEVNYVVEGHVRDFDGRIYGPGEAMLNVTGSEHEFFVTEDADVLMAVVVRGFDVIGYPSKKS